VEVQSGVNIYLVRHGEAESERTSPERPLTRLGRDEVERVAGRAATKRVQVSAIFHSGILRAKQTAEIMAEHLQPALGVRELAGLLPQDDPDIAKAELEHAEHPIILVGHLPHLNRLAALLIGGHVESGVMEFPPATMVCCARDGSKWKITWTLTPRTL
jgi:phosphohistidine phosphatase